MDQQTTFSIQTMDHNMMEAAKRRGMAMRGAAIREFFAGLFGPRQPQEQASQANWAAARNAGDVCAAQ